MDGLFYMLRQRVRDSEQNPQLLTLDVPHTVNAISSPYHYT